MSAEKRERPRAWHQSPSMSELLASCAAADAVSTPPGGQPRDDADPQRAEETAPEPRPVPAAPRRKAA